MLKKYLYNMEWIFRKLSLFIPPKIHVHTLTQEESSTMRKISLKSRPCNGFEDFGSHGSSHKIAVLCRGGRICQQRTYYRIKTIICRLQPLLTIHPHYCSHFLHALILHTESTVLCTNLYQFCLSKALRLLGEVSSNRTLKLNDYLEIVK